jgi:hypothetical protein
MPLRDHFHPPLDNEADWDTFHAGWPMVIVQGLTRILPARFTAGIRVHPGAAAKVDVAGFELDEERVGSPALNNGSGGVAVATAVWAPPRPTFTVATDLPASDEYEVQIYDRKRGRTLVAAIEIVSPANKDRPEHRRAFVAKCSALLQRHVSVIIIDLVTSRHFNLYAELLESIGHADPAMGEDSDPLYATACRATKSGKAWRLEAWAHRLAVRQPLPTLPLWVADDLAFPLDLEASYESTCRDLRLPPALPPA